MFGSNPDAQSTPRTAIATFERARAPHLRRLDALAARILSRVSVETVSVVALYPFGELGARPQTLPAVDERDGRASGGEQQRVLGRGVAAADDQHVLARDRPGFEPAGFEHAAPLELRLAGHVQAPAPDARRDDERDALNSSRSAAHALRLQVDSPISASSQVNSLSSTCAAKQVAPPRPFDALTPGFSSVIDSQHRPPTSPRVRCEVSAPLVDTARESPRRPAPI